jgi:hypothetical protein
MSISNATVSHARNAYEWGITITATLLLGPMVLPFAVDIATTEGGWRPWALVCFPMVGVAVFGYVALQFVDPFDVVLQIGLLLVVGVLMVLVDRAGFNGL